MVLNVIYAQKWEYRDTVKYFMTRHQRSYILNKIDQAYYNAPLLYFMI